MVKWHTDVSELASEIVRFFNWQDSDPSSRPEPPPRNLAFFPSLCFNIFNPAFI
jgi:hypothetical protein